MTPQNHGRRNLTPESFAVAARFFGAALLIALISPHQLADAQDSEVLRGHRGCVFSLAFSPDGDLLVSGAGDHVVRFWQLAEPKVDPQRQKQVAKWLKDLDDDRFDVRQHASDRLAAEGHQVEKPLQDLFEKTKSAEVRLRARYLLAALAVPPGIGHEGDVRCVAYSPEGSLVASGSRDNTLRLWRIPSGRTVASMKAHTDGVWSVAFSPDGSLLASGGGDHQIRLWHPAAGTLMTILEGHNSTVQHLAFSPDGRTLASAGGFDRTIRLWDVATGQLIDTLTAHTDAVLCLAYSADGERFASAGYDGVIHLWRSAGAEHLREIPVGQAVIRAVAFRPRDGLLVSAGDDRAVRLWNPDTGGLLATWKPHADAVQSLVISSDGRQMATGDREGLIRLWNVPPAEARGDE